MAILDAVLNVENAAYNETRYVVARILLTLLLTFIISKLAALVTRKLRKTKIHLRFLHNIINALIWATGFGLALDHIPNFDSGIQTLLAGSGIAALTIGLAAQESIGNIINGMVLTISKPFEVGDRVRLIGGNITGFVEDITMRHTVIRTFINSRIIIPNSVINKDMIENSNYFESRASSFIDVIIKYDTDIERAREIIASIVGSNPAFVDNRTPEQMDQPKVKVFVRALGLFGVELRTSMWTVDIASNFEACSDVRLKIKHAFDHEGIEFAAASAAAIPPVS